MTRRTIYVLLGLALVVAALALAFGRAPKDALFVPTDRNEVIEELSASGAKDGRVSTLRHALDENPADLETALRLARIEIELARQAGDPRHLGRAEAALRPWWNLPSPPGRVLVLRATIEQSLHDFDAALVHLDAALTLDPRDVQAWLTRATVLMARGRFDEARASCQRIAPIASAVIFTVCEAQVDGLTGHVREARARLVSIVDGSDPRVTESERAWAASSLAELAQRNGDLDDAERRFRKALTLDPADAYARSALADLLVDRGRFEDAIMLVRDRDANDTLLLRLAIAETRAGSARAREHADALGERFDASRQRGDVVHRREEARYWLELRGDAKRALALAKDNWDVQREPADLRVYLAAALAARDRAAVQIPLAWLAQTKLEDPEIEKLAVEAREMR